MNAAISCIIPFYNERKYILNVLNTVTKCTSISQIICVDDGSTDDTAPLVQANFPDIKLVRLTRNSGKSNAVKCGLDLVKTGTILLLDADLQNLSHVQLDEAAAAMHFSNDIDMIILRRINAPIHLRLLRADTLLTGERVIKTNDLKRIFEDSFSDYQLEIAINLFMYRNNKNVFWFPSSALNTFKLHKIASINSIVKDLKMYGSVIRYAGWKDLLILYTSFGKKKLTA